MRFVCVTIAVGIVAFCSTACRQFVLEQSQKGGKKRSFFGSLFGAKQKEKN